MTLLALVCFSSEVAEELHALAAILAMEMLEVFVARIVLGEQCVASSLKTLCLTGKDSETASITSWTSRSA